MASFWVDQHGCRYYPMPIPPLDHLCIAHYPLVSSLYSHCVPLDLEATLHTLEEGENFLKVSATAPRFSVDIA